MTIASLVVKFNGRASLLTEQHEYLAVRLFALDFYL